jgi:hypothetical protein
MTMSVLSFCRYLSIPRGEEWRDEDYGAWMFVKAAKEEAFNGYAHLNIDGNRKLFRSSDLGNPDKARAWFGELVGGLQWSPKRVYLAPIPDSGCTTGARRLSKTYPLASAAVANLKIAALWDGLRLKKALTKSREGGPRDVETIYRNLEVIAPIPTDAQIILIDDVCTTGGHLKAAAKRIVEGGGRCSFSICIARTANDKTRPGQGVLTDPL